MTQVHISGPNHTVTVNHDGGDLTYVIEKTQKLYDETKPVDRSLGPGYAGFQQERKGQWDHDHHRPVRAEEPR